MTKTPHHVIADTDNGVVYAVGSSNEGGVASWTHAPDLALTLEEFEADHLASYERFCTEGEDNGRRNVRHAPVKPDNGLAKKLGNDDAAPLVDLGRLTSYLADTLSKTELAEMVVERMTAEELQQTLSEADDGGY